ncbi:MAG: DUF4366 domain-containing protein [Deltaproteobacteria bacterium]|nr:DUF4366 domain-containing protein [Deltaproteobacteria bacterium]
MADAPRTEFASKAIQLGSLFEIKFAKLAFTGATPRQVKVTANVGESSGGGKMARESIMLMPTDGNSHNAVVCGWMDVGQAVAELRSYASVKARHEARFQKGFDVKSDEYERFIADARQFFTDESITTTLIDDAPSVPAAAEVEKSGGGMGMVLAIIALLLVVGGGAAAFFLLK